MRTRTKDIRSKSVRSSRQGQLGIKHNTQSNVKAIFNQHSADMTTSLNLAVFLSYLRQSMYTRGEGKRWTGLKLSLDYEAFQLFSFEPLRNTHSPTDPFTISKPKNPPIDELYGVRILSTDGFLGLKIVAGYVVRLTLSLQTISSFSLIVLPI